MTAHHTLPAGSDKPAGQPVTLIDRSGCPADQHGDDNAYCHHKCRCPDAKEDRRVRRKRRRLGVAAPDCIPAAGTRRRIEAMLVEGWSLGAQAEMLGVAHDTVAGYRVQKFVRVATAARVKALYLDLWDWNADAPKRGPSNLTRSRALNRGFLPAAVWDDIDNPHERPKTGSRGRPARKPKYVREVPAETRDAEIARLTASGMSAAKIAEELSATLRQDLSERTVVRARARLREAQALPEAA